MRVAPHLRHLARGRIEPADAQALRLAGTIEPDRLVVDTERNRPVAIRAGLLQQFPIAAVSGARVDHAIAGQIITHGESYVTVMVG
jgi:hypothetical protein